MIFMVFRTVDHVAIEQLEYRFNPWLTYLLLKPCIHADLNEEESSDLAEISEAYTSIHKQL